MEEPYYRIFFSDDKLLSLYTTAQITSFPSHFNYGTELMPKILKAIVTQDHAKLVDNLDRLTLLDPVERLRLLINSSLVGDIGTLELGSGHQTPGEKLIKYLEDHIHDFKGLLVSESGQPVSESESMKFYMTFTDDWKEVYALQRMFSVSRFTGLMGKFYVPKRNKEAARMRDEKNMGK
jgi:hypothetical protein